MKFVALALFRSVFITVMIGVALTGLVGPRSVLTLGFPEVAVTPLRFS